MTDNKRVSNKQILDEIKALTKEGVNVELDPMTEEELNLLATKIVSRMVKLKTMESWFDHVSYSQEATVLDYENLDMTEEEDALGEAARLMTLMNLFQDKEEYEKCAIIKRRLDVINRILKDEL